MQKASETGSYRQLTGSNQVSQFIGDGELKFLNARRTADKAGFSVATLHRSVALGNFPHPIKVGETMVRWVSTEVDDWIRQRIEEHRRDALRKAGSKGGRAKARGSSAGGGA